MTADRWRRGLAVALAMTLPAPAGPGPDLSGTTPNQFIARGAPTFVVGTLGDDRADREIDGQARSIRDLLFARSEVVADTSVDLARGADGWPKNPIVYGSGANNALLARLAPTLPIRVEPGKLTLGDRAFEGADLRLIAVIPARAADADGPGYPEFLLYASTGSTGLVGINDIWHGSVPIEVHDAFGRLVAGGWKRAEGSPPAPEFPEGPAPRPDWRAVDRRVADARGNPTVAVEVRSLASLPPSADQDRVADACARGVALASGRLGIVGPAAVRVHVYPSRAAKRTLTGDGGDGRAQSALGMVHVLRYDPAEKGPMEGLVAHEATHALADRAWGRAGTALMGEGLAVWASGRYAGVALDDWPGRLARPTPGVADLLGEGFRKLPEATAYPLAGLFVAGAIDLVGLENVRDHLYRARTADWPEACRKAGTTPEALEQALKRKLGE